ncbi:MAG TPA: polysaccharide biosynthesis/export family protein [Gemmatimonadota bacterium]|nr:polysaccharide biosynthesis/export family protein [Gemmatimonadota bacterium]
MRDRRDLRRAAFAVAAVLLCATPARAQNGSTATSPAEAYAAAVPLQPGDMVRVSLWQEPQLSGEFPVDESGLVALPLLGVRHVTRLPANQVKRQLAEEYSRQLRNQPAHITLLRRVRILGAVANPGLYHVDPTLSLGDVVALAGGVQPDGDDDDVRVTRRGQVYQASLERGLGVSWVESGDEIFVPRNSWLERNATWFLGAIISATTLILTRR